MTSNISKTNCSSSNASAARFVNSYIVSLVRVLELHVGSGVW